MDGFTLPMALMDAVPVIFFGISMILTAMRFGSPLFILGAAVSTFAGCCKVCWKLVLGIRKKDLRWLNRPFVPMQSAGFGMILISLILGAGRISWTAVFSAMTRFPAVIFFLLWLSATGCMVWFRKARFDNSPRANWIAQTINCIAQSALLLGLLTA